MLRNNPILFQLLIGGLTLVGIVGLLSSHLTAQNQGEDPNLTRSVTSSPKDNQEKSAGGMEDNRESSDAVSTVSLSISFAKKFALPARLVVLEVVATNRSSEVVSTDMTLPERDFSVIAKDERNQTMPLTRYGSMAADSARYKNTKKLLKPGESAKFELMINRLVDLSVSGKYQVSVSRKFYQGNRVVTARSNFAEVVIDETASDQIE